MIVYRAKRNVALPGGVWKQNTDRELDPSSDLARNLLAAGKIAPVGSALVEEVRPAQPPAYPDAAAAALAAEREQADDDLGDQDFGDGSEDQADQVPDDDQPVDPGPFASPPAAPKLASFPAE